MSDHGSNCWLRYIRCNQDTSTVQVGVFQEGELKQPNLKGFKCFGFAGERLVTYAWEKSLHGVNLKVQNFKNPELLKFKSEKLVVCLQIINNFK